MNITADVIRFKALAGTIQALAAQYDVVLPEDHARLSQVAVAATTAAADARVGASPVAVPEDPNKVAAVIKKAATDRVTQREAVVVAEDLAQRAESSAAQIALGIAPQLAQAIKQRFDDDAAELVEMAPSTPVDLVATSTVKEFGLFTRARALADTLTAAAQARIALVPVLGEDLRTIDMPWLILAPHHHITRDTITQASADYAENLPATLEDWLRVTTLGVTLAAPGQAQSRASQFNAAVYASGYGSEDGGMNDRTLGEMLQALGTHQAAQ